MQVGAGTGSRIKMRSIMQIGLTGEVLENISAYISCDESLSGCDLWQNWRRILLHFLAKISCRLSLFLFSVWLFTSLCIYLVMIYFAVSKVYRVVQKSFPVMNGIFHSLPERTFGPPCICCVSGPDNWASKSKRHLLYCDENVTFVSFVSITFQSFLIYLGCECFWIILLMPVYIFITDFTEGT